MALQYFAATSAGYRYGEYVGGVFIGVIVTGANLVYDVTGMPVSGTISAMEFPGSRLSFDGSPDDLGKITFQQPVQVTTLTAKGFDWFASASSDGTNAFFDVTTIISKFDKLGLFAQVTPPGTPSPYQIIVSGNQDDRVYATSDPFFTGEIFTGAGKDKIFVDGFSVYVDAGAENDNVTVSALSAVVVGGTGKDTITLNVVGGVVDSGADDDKVNVTATGEVEVYGGTGHDQITLTGVGTPEDNAYSALVQAGKGNDQIFGSSLGGELLQGNEGNDYIETGGVRDSDGIDIADGGAGNDFILGGEGEGISILYGGEGNDMVIGGLGFDILWGGAGNDDLANYGGDDVVVLDEGTDQAFASSGSEVFILMNSEVDTTGVVFGFDTESDEILIDTDDNMNADDTYDYFLENAVQDGLDTRFDDGAGHILILKNTDLDQITVDNFMDDSFDGQPFEFWF
jgi:Ca2+-binding RTX toxin-like protein